MASLHQYRLLLKTFLIFLLAAVIIVFLEAAAGRLIPAPDNFYIWPPGMERTFLPDQTILPGTSPRVWFRTNSYGLRSFNPAPNDDSRVLVLGGSAAECLYLNQRVTWPRLMINYLEDGAPNLQTWVGNGGRSGQSSRDHIFHIRYLPLRAMDIDTIVILMGVNDLLLRLRRGEYYNPDFLDTPRAHEFQLDHAFMFVPYRYSLPPPPFFKKTALWRVARRIKNRFFSEPPQDGEGKIVAEWRGLRRQSKNRIDELPPLKSALREYLSNIDEIIQLASTRGIRLIFVTQPALWHTSMSEDERRRLWMGGVGNFKSNPDSPYYTVEALTRGLEVYNSLLKSYCRWRGAECFDLAEDFPQTPEYFYDDCHFTVKGSKIVAQRISDYLLLTPPWKPRQFED